MLVLSHFSFDRRCATSNEQNEATLKVHHQQILLHDSVHNTLIALSSNPLHSQSDLH